MKFIIKLFPEIVIKSKSVRKRFNKILEGNLRTVLKRIDDRVRIRSAWDRMEVQTPDGLDLETQDALIAAMCRTPGISAVQQVEQCVYESVDHIYQEALKVYGAQLAGKTFCVRVKRLGNQDFSSLDVERYVGGGLNQNTDAIGVKLKKPDIEVRLDINNDVLSMVTRQHKGLGGFPIATQESVLSLISGGFDSGVSSFQFIKRGCRVHYCFFNLGGDAHESGVREMAYHIWQRYGFSHRVKFVAVPFEDVVADILENVENGYMGVVLKRQMMRAASKVADNLNIQALVTGEAVGQVSSQTISNLRVIDEVSEHVIMRPLIVSDKQTIIDQAIKIGTHDLAASMPEFCGVISKSPTIKASPKRLAEEEAKLNLSLIDEVVYRSNTEDIRDILNTNKPAPQEVEIVAELVPHSHVIDVRSDEEVEASPLELNNAFVEHIPFFKLNSEFPKLDANTDYYLYCDRGVMSRLQAIHLNEAGFANAKVYRP
ncbi:tRNA uracil 4-sulfurtransferase ThiI [Echinimonas agarilytica]|uniref:tRNA sulfurtransferase n=1 Tax=Echinimonas agarilytica TaxID=1215918 RepID=A0AA41W8E2_9GAMM|nr:tRNA uracil 4-sulfurtransferase ThiI [Echinimonas agarilytica]MCM2680548.1 tRNA 4-thiouridine(8) synthase ThiI [Echinimonas agarilytica]